MPQYSKPVIMRGARAEASGTSTIKGSEAGQDKKYEEREEQTLWDEYKKANKLSFAATKVKHAKAFGEWKTERAAKKAGQKRAAGTIAAAE